MAVLLVRIPLYTLIDAAQDTPSHHNQPVLGGSFRIVKANSAPGLVANILSTEVVTDNVTSVHFGTYIGATNSAPCVPSVSRLIVYGSLSSWVGL